METLTPLDRALLDELQKDFPISPRPFAVLGERLDLEEREVVARVAAWRKTGIIRRLGPVFEPRRLGYKGVLCAANVSTARLEQVAAVINQEPGVTHNYLREARWPAKGGAAVPGTRVFNLWFTLTAASDQELERALGAMRSATGLGADELVVLPSIRIFKIKVEFPVGSDFERPASEQVEYGSGEPDEDDGGRSEPGPVQLERNDWDLIEGLQDELPATPRPFASLAERLGLSEDEICARIDRLKTAHVIRRFGATLKHFAVGYKANAMVVWRVAPEMVEKTGRLMAGFRAVSHCYERAVVPRWPYNLYTMVHGMSADDVFGVISGIEKGTGVREYLPLFTVRELKKDRMRYRRPGQ